MKFKKNDMVKVVAGKDKGKTGKITQIFVKYNKVVVEGLNLRHKHMRPKKQGEKGQRIEYAAPIDASNVMHLDTKTGQVSRVGFKILESGEKVRISRKSGEVI